MVDSNYRWWDVVTWTSRQRLRTIAWLGGLGVGIGLIMSMVTIIAVVLK